MTYYPGNSAPPLGPPSTSNAPNVARPQESARAQRANQAQYVEERLRNGLSPTAGDNAVTARALPVDYRGGYLATVGRSCAKTTLGMAMT